MTIDALRGRSTVQQDHGNQSSVTPDREAKTPDFSASIFSAVHLPTALIAHTSSVSKLRADVAGKLAGALYALDKGDTKEFLTALKEGFDFPAKLKALVDAHHEFMKANGPKTNAAFSKVAHDLVELDKSQAVLVADAAKAVTP